MLRTNLGQGRRVLPLPVRLQQAACIGAAANQAEQLDAIAHGPVGHKGVRNDLDLCTPTPNKVRTALSITCLRSLYPLHAVPY